mmetsp:Transcript_8835/g.27852  ORF Transcript_8835/g.27852 Transcript_8835/m.27852 type:complete len:321 (+) Transcript_8835:544-1506(+)
MNGGDSEDTASSSLGASARPGRRFGRSRRGGRAAALQPRKETLQKLLRGSGGAGAGLDALDALGELAEQLHGLCCGHGGVLERLCNLFLLLLQQSRIDGGVAVLALQQRSSHLLLGLGQHALMTDIQVAEALAEERDAEDNVEEHVVDEVGGEGGDGVWVQLVALFGLDGECVALVNERNEDVENEEDDEHDEGQEDERAKDGAHKAKSLQVEITQHGSNERIERLKHVTIAVHVCAERDHERLRCAEEQQNGDDGEATESPGGVDDSVQQQSEARHDLHVLVDLDPAQEHVERNNVIGPPQEMIHGKQIDKIICLDFHL